MEKKKKKRSECASVMYRMHRKPCVSARAKRVKEG